MELRMTPRTFEQAQVYNQYNPSLQKGEIQPINR